MLLDRYGERLGRHRDDQSEEDRPDERKKHRHDSSQSRPRRDLSVADGGRGDHREVRAVAERQFLQDREDRAGQQHHRELHPEDPD